MPTVKDIVISKTNDAEAARYKDWPIWTCEPSTFDWDYTQTETCLILEGKVTVKDRPGEASVSFGPGDAVVFPVGLKCIWQIEEAVRKHYSFS